MKETILKRLKKYNTGGDFKKATSFLAKGIKAGSKFAGRSFLGPFATLLGANKAYATPVYDESGVNRFTGEYLGTGEPLPTVDVNQINKELSEAMAPKMQMGGVEPLPGGVAAPIPGSDAVEFMGNKHDESGMGSDSGIMMDPQTEVEDGETMDQVTMKHGGKRDYFFSSHLKEDGMSYADMHKNVLAMGGAQEDVDYLARMQEKAAGRDPNQVAKLGGVMKYQSGGEEYNTNYKLVTSDATRDYNKYLDSLTPQDRGPMSFEDWQESQEKQDRDLQKLLNPGMPSAAKVGAAAQFIPAITAMFTKQKDPEEFTFTPGFTSPIVAGRVKGLKYEAPTQDESRARLASSYLGQLRFLDTSGAGPAGLSNRQALFAKKIQAEGSLGAQESVDKLKAETMTKKSQEIADARNVQNELKAATLNAQLAQKEADRKMAIDNANAKLRNMRENEKIANRMAIASNLASGVAGVTGDLLSYNAQERLAKALGSEGIYERDLLFNYLSKQPGNENKTKDELNQMVLEILNK